MKAIFLTAIVVISIVSCATSSNPQTQLIVKDITCFYNLESGKPNPLGMRTFITAVEKKVIQLLHTSNCPPRYLRKNQ
jgi:hypothetical protein